MRRDGFASGFHGGFAVPQRHPVANVLGRLVGTVLRGFLLGTGFCLAWSIFGG